MTQNQTAIAFFAAYADVSDLAREINFRPCTNIEDGLLKFVKWYKEYS